MKSTLKNENTPGGRAFKVTITETYQRTVTIYESEMKEPTVEEAQRVAEDWWRDSQIELGKEDFQGVEFTGRGMVRQMFELISRNPSRYYLAYGSNLDMERMGKRCPYAVVVGTTEIKGYRLLFKKSKTGCYATIEQDANESVPAVVWKLSEYDELLLDRYEGCPRYYYKKQFQLPVWNLNGNRMKKAKPCIAYVMHEDRRLGCPDAEYFELLRGGYSDWEFPLDTLKRGLAASIGRAEAIRYLKKRQMM